MNRFVAVVAFFVIFAAGCGVERSSEDTLAQDAADQASEDQLSAEGGDTTASTEGSEQSEDSTTTEPPFAPPTTGVPAEVALTADFGGTVWEITHGELNDIVLVTQDNQEFVDLVFGGVQPPGFTAGVLTEELISEALRVELADLGESITDEDLEASRLTLLEQVATLFAEATDPSTEAERLYGEVPYLPFLAEYQAGQDVLSAALADKADSGQGAPCVRHILVETKAAADDVIARLNGGEDFGEVAVEVSTGPSGPSGGELGCAQSSNYVPAFAAAVDSAEIGAFVGPIETEFGWHVIVVDGYEVDGRALATEQLRARLAAAKVEVDENIGTWDSERLLIIPLGA